MDVTGLQGQVLQPENDFEANVSRAWWTRDRVLREGEWKSKAIALAWSLLG